MTTYPVDSTVHRCCNAIGRHDLLCPVGQVYHARLFALESLGHLRVLVDNAEQGFSAPLRNRERVEMAIEAVKLLARELELLSDDEGTVRP